MLQEVRDKISATLRGRILTPPESRQYGTDHHNYGKPAPRGAGIGKGSYCLKGHWVRSTWEREVADWLYERGVEYKYESELFDLGDGIRYRPDFHITERDLWLEVKGYETAVDKEKFSRFIASGRQLLIVDKQMFKTFMDSGTLPLVAAA